MPEPVLPAMSACCAVPRPSVSICRLVAPARPIGMSKPFAVLPVQIASLFGMMKSNGTSTRAAERLASPMRRIVAATVAPSGGVSSVSGNTASSGSSGTNLPSFSTRLNATCSRSARRKSRGKPAFVSMLTSVQTPHAGPLLMMLIRRRAVSGVKFVGKLAITNTRYGSATSPAAAL